MLKIFADDTFHYSNVLDIDKLITELNTDIQKISQWANQRKIQFNVDPKK